MKTIRIAILDDHAVVRHGLVSHLAEESSIEIVGVYETSRELIRGMATMPANVLLLDFALGRDELDGVSLIRALRSRFPDCRILVLSSHHESATVSLALRVGARGFVGKDEGLGSLVKAIRTVASGAIYLSADMSYQVADAARPGESTQTPISDNALQRAALSAREQEVIRCYLEGMTVTEIAEKFNRSIKTISTQKATAFRKLGVTSNNGLFKIMKTLD
ncbi:response regulator transcription factor [Pseudomonas yamanorum]|jgi:DNA-binding NarL/FixJ family response regulator|uniref:Response regulator transcription factor n=1 Tax=Pseudomonas yamanorum TaxID=515393 RepID=A0A1H2IP92_9PSED|nr:MULTISPECIES: response regulator transcription factor [Pseudomonas]MBV6663861.1 response regulator transcription factor [Pseudomonas yamanorum]MDR0192687.1 response regulator transcription factor [Pseudomonas yamanorum]NWD45909.1 response regulator transcription factor [Pseudomonas yamanorum]WVN19433.1 response regulator transcription factor [Pseudomonas yamanorum]SDU45668.1 two component transcriptional regulator, LuxR family [Pseudomonas yamanorum]